LCRAFDDLARNCLFIRVATIVILITHGAGVFAQQDIAPFKLSNVDGVLLFGYSLDDDQNDYLVGNDSYKTDIWREQLLFRTRSYVYHPALLDILFNGGPTFRQIGNASANGSSSYSETTFSYDLRLNFLGRKSYPFTIFLSEEQPDVALGLSGRYPSEVKTYGINGRLMEPLTSLGISWGLSRDDRTGAGLGASLDSSRDAAYFKMSLPNPLIDNLRLDADWSESFTRSGSPGLTPTESLRVAEGIRVAGENELGADNQVNLRHNLNWGRLSTEGANATESDRLAYSTGLTWRHSARHRSNGSIRYRDDDRGIARQTSYGFNAGSNWRPYESWRLGGSGSYSHSRNFGTTRDKARVSARASYTSQLPFGRVTLTGTLGEGRSDQTSSSDVAEEFDEPVTLIGIEPVDLARDFVVLETVTVISGDRTRTYLEGIDYLLTTIGSTTSIERLATGNILDGEEVLVSYGFLTGGTVEYASRSSSIGANLVVSASTNLYFRLGNYETRVLSGASTTSLNDNRTMEFGGRSRFSLPGGWSINGEFRLRDREEDISPYKSGDFNVYLQTARYWRTTVRFGAAWNVTDYEYSEGELSRFLYSVSVNSFLPGGVQLAYQGTYSTSDGDGFDRETYRNMLRLYWRYRLVDFSLSATQSDSRQDGIGRESTRVLAEVRRLF
jgi:hypothetical protein